MPKTIKLEIRRSPSQIKKTLSVVDILWALHHGLIQPAK